MSPDRPSDRRPDRAAHRRPRVAGERRRPVGEAPDAPGEVSAGPAQPTPSPADVESPRPRRRWPLRGAKAAGVPATEPAPPSEGPDHPVPAEPRAPRRRPGLVAGVLTGLCVLLVITDVLFYTGLPGVFSGIHNRAAVSSARTEAVSAASDAAVSLLSYDYRHMDADIAAAAKHLTPTFRREYVKTADAVKQPAKDSQARVSALVSDAGVIQASADQATVLLFVTQTVQNTKLSAPRADLYRVRMRMENVDGHWLVDSVEAL